MNKIPYWQWDAFMEALTEYIEATIQNMSDTSVETHMSKMKAREHLDVTVTGILEVVEEKE